ncbi:MAG: hypothetical protein FVQ77_01105 [Cytophagales bacterium]|nr:hypothetical protein [Cytophagales bacterium]
METKNQKIRFGVLAGIVLFAAFSRLIPHPPNFTPLIAIALFGGAYFTNKKWAFTVPLLAMILSDIGLTFMMGYEFFTSMRVVVYSCFVVITLIGFLLHSKVKVLNVVLASLSGSVLFFIVANFAVWIGGTHNLYPKNIAGLIECYVAAIPFFKNTVISALVYSGVLFGSFELLKYRFPVLSKANS